MNEIWNAAGCYWLDVVFFVFFKRCSKNSVADEQSYSLWFWPRIDFFEFVGHKARSGTIMCQHASKLLNRVEMTQITLKWKSQVEWLDWCIANDSWSMMIHVSGLCSFVAYLESPRFGDNDQCRESSFFFGGGWEGGRLLPAHLLTSYLKRTVVHSAKSSPKRGQKKKITYYEAPQTFWNRPFSPPPPKKNDYFARMIW